MNYHLFGDKYLSVPNEPEALVINYYLKADAPPPAKITVTDSTGRIVRQVDGPAKRGLNRAFASLSGAFGGRGPSTGSGQTGGGRGAGSVEGPLPIGDYVVTVDVAGETLTKPAHVRARIQ